jgi:nucleoside-diphosphate-sugar epimerase
MNNKISVLVTGSSGFIGRHLVPYLAARGYKVTAASRTPLIFEDRNIAPTLLPDLTSRFDWQPMLKNYDAVIHLAGIAHVPSDEDTLDRVNRLATASLAEAAERCGTHLIFVSSIAAQSGSYSPIELTEDDTPRPSSGYGRSKLAAEHAVRASGAMFTILRPVVIYGEGEKGNFAFFHRISRLPIPLPFGRLTVKRSVLSIHNFCSAVQLVLTSSRAREETFIVSDPEPVALPELIARYRTAMGRSPLMLSIPQQWIELSLKAIGQRSLWLRIGCPLIARPRKLLVLGWKPT